MTSSALETLDQQVTKIQTDFINDLLARCTTEQQAFFKRIFPNGPSPDQLRGAIKLIERTIVKRENDLASAAPSEPADA